MTQCLPTGNYRELDPSQFTEEFILWLPDDGPTGYQLVVDGFVPPELHDQLSELPPCPDLEATDASPYMANLIDRNGLQRTDAERLTCSFRPKVRYSVHYRALKVYMKLGFKLTKVHQVIAFNQSEWLKPYVEANQAARLAATSKFQKDLHKLRNNALFGSFLLDPSGFSSVRTYSLAQESRLVKLSSQPHMGHAGDIRILSPEKVAVEEPKTRIHLYRPWPVGTSILDIAKARLYDVWYNQIKPLWPSAELCYIDTDSYVVKVTSDEKPPGP